jgi:hypothetical protein
MVAWMFCHKAMENGNPLLLNGIPKALYQDQFAVKGLGTSFGTLDIEADANSAKIHFLIFLKRTFAPFFVILIQ